MVGEGTHEDSDFDGADAALNGPGYTYDDDVETCSFEPQYCVACGCRAGVNLSETHGRALCVSCEEELPVILPS